MPSRVVTARAWSKAGQGLLEGGAEAGAAGVVAGVGDGVVVGVGELVHGKSNGWMTTDRWAWLSGR